MSEPRQQLLTAIEDAFHGVELGSGVRLHETVVIADHGGSAERTAARLPDEKRDWRRLIRNPELVNTHGVGGLNFYDAVGLRFHLPAYLSLAVIDFDRADASNVFQSLMFNLTDFSEYQVGRLSILSAPQRQCVRDVLSFLRAEYELESAELDEAISGYWSSEPGAASHAEPGAAKLGR